MKLLTAKQIKHWDAYTILHEPISSLDLMERAASLCTQRILELLKDSKIQSIYVFCGPGNNGGDGLVIARRLVLSGKSVKVFLVKTGSMPTADYETNLKRLPPEVSVIAVENEQQLPAPGCNILIVDAIFGSGLNRAPEGAAAKAIDHINGSSSYIVAVDVPSGLPAEVYDIESITNRSIVEANLTLTFQQPKQSFFHAECYPFTGKIEVIDIGLLPEFVPDEAGTKYYVTPELIQPIYRQRSKFSHKGTFGHVLIVSGSYGKLGAAVLCSKAALRAGCGLLTSFIPKVGFTVLQTALPEAMVQTDDELFEIRNFPDASSFDAIGVGPGLGANSYTEKAFAKWLLAIRQPVVLDADALNICSKLLQDDEHFRFPSKAILTPHPKEFDRLAGHSNNSFERLQKQILFARKHNVIVVLKGAHTGIAIPDGTLYFNSTGNPALATAGSGDVLTGIITSLLAQQYTLAQAAVMGVYLHGLCADLWVAQGRQTMIAGDIIGMLSQALYQLNKWTFHET